MGPQAPTSTAEPWPRTADPVVLHANGSAGSGSGSRASSACSPPTACRRASSVTSATSPGSPSSRPIAPSRAAGPRGRSVRISRWHSGSMTSMTVRVCSVSSVRVYFIPDPHQHLSLRGGGQRMCLAVPAPVQQCAVQEQVGSAHAAAPGRSPEPAHCGTGAPQRRRAARTRRWHVAPAVAHRGRCHRSAPTRGLPPRGRSAEAFSRSPAWTWSAVARVSGSASTRASCSSGQRAGRGWPPPVCVVGPSSGSVR